MQALTSDNVVSESDMLTNSLPRDFLNVDLTDLTNLSNHPPYQGAEGILNFHEGAAGPYFLTKPLAALRVLALSE